MIEGDEKLRIHAEPFKIVKGDQTLKKVNLSMLLPEEVKTFENSEGQKLDETISFREVEEFKVSEGRIDDFVFKTIIELLYARSKMNLMEAENPHKTAKDNVKKMVSRMELSGYSNDLVDRVLDEYHKPDEPRQEEDQENLAEAKE